MAEQALVAELMIDLTKFNSSLAQATQAADKASKNMVSTLSQVGKTGLTLDISGFKSDLSQATQAASNAAKQISSSLGQASTQGLSIDVSGFKSDLSQATQAAGNAAKQISSTLGQVGTNGLSVDVNGFRADLSQAAQTASSASSQISSSLSGISDSANGIAPAIDDMNHSLKDTGEHMGKAGAASEKFNRVLGGLKTGFATLGIGLSVTAVLAFVKSMGSAAETMSSVERQLKQLTGSSKEASKQMDFIREVTERLGLSTVEGAKGFAQLANAAKDTAIAGEGVKTIFSGMNTMAKALSLSTEKYGSVMAQVTQSVSKGKVAYEELAIIQESGIPIQQKLAKSMGITTSALTDLLQKGQVSSENLIRLFKDIDREYEFLAKTAGETVPGQFAKGFNKIKNEFIDVFKGIMDSPALKNMFKFDPDDMDIFPSRAEISKRVDEFIGELKKWALLATTLFEVVKTNWAESINEMAQLWNKMWASFVSFMAPVDQALRRWFDKIPGVQAFRDAIGLGIRQGVADATVALDSMGNPIDALTEKLREINELEPLTLFDKDATGRLAAGAADAMYGPYANVLDQIMGKTEEIKEDIERNPIILADEKANKKVLEDYKQLALQVISDIQDAQIGISNRMAEDAAEVERRVARIREGAGLPPEDIDTMEMDFVPTSPGIELTTDEKKFEETIANMKENLQSMLADSIVGALKGEAGSIQDAIKGILDFATKGIAQIISGSLVDTLVDAAKPWIASLQKGMSGLGDTLKKGFEKAVGWLSEKIKGMGGGGGAGGGGLGGMGAMGKAGAAVGAVGAGVGIGMGVSELAGGGPAGSIAGGVLGGAASGAMLGATFAAWGGVTAIVGAAVGAVVGAVVGGITAAVSAGVFEKEVKTALITQTDAEKPTEGALHDISRQTPFGHISLFEESDAGQATTSSALTLLADTDFAIASFLDRTSEEIVKTYLQAAVPEGSTVRSKEANDAIAKAVQLRWYHAITALAGEDVAKNVVGEAFTATEGDIQTIQQRGGEALQILEAIADFKAGPLSATAQAIKSVNKQFEDMAARAMSLGIPTGEIEAEQARQLAQITTDFNEGVSNSILAIIDPIEAAYQALYDRQEKRRQEAIDAGADLAAVDRLSALEKEQLDKRMADSAIAQAERVADQAAAFNQDVANKLLAMKDPIAAQWAELDQMQLARWEEAKKIGADLLLLDQLNAAERLLLAQQIHDAQLAFNLDISTQLLAIRDPIAAQWAQLNQQQLAMWEAAKAAGADLALTETLFAAQRVQLAQQQHDAILNLNRDIAIQILGFTDPVKAQWAELRQSQLARWEDAKRLGADEATFAALRQLYAEEDADLARKNTQLRLDFDRDIELSILDLTDQGLAGYEQMMDMQQARIDEAERLDGDMHNVMRLNYYETMQYFRNLANQMMDIASSLQIQAARDTGGRQGNKVAENSELAQKQGREWQNLWNTTHNPQLMKQLADNQLAERRRLKAQQDQDDRNAASQATRAAVGSIRPPTRSTSGGGSRPPAARGSSGSGSRTPSSSGGSSAASDKARKAEEAKREKERIAAEKKAAAEKLAADKKANAEAIRQFLLATLSQTGQQIIGLTDNFVKLRDEAIRVGNSTDALTSSYNLQVAVIKRAATESLQAATYALIDPFQAGMLMITQQMREFRKLAAEGFIPNEAYVDLQRLLLGNHAITQAINQISGVGNANSGIVQVAEAFEAFRTAGSPLSQSQQQLYNLTETFLNLSDAANALSLNTHDLENSYIRQARAIRQTAIKAIDDSLAPRRAGVKSIDDFLQQMRMGEDVSGGKKISEARGQFLRAIKFNDVEAALKFGQQYQSTARENYGSTTGFTNIRREIESLMTGLREREQIAIQAERERLIRQEETALEQLDMTRTSTDYLRRMVNDGSHTSAGIFALLTEAKAQTAYSTQSLALLKRLAAQMRA